MAKNSLPAVQDNLDISNIDEQFNLLRSEMEPAGEDIIAPPPGNSEFAVPADEIERALRDAEAESKREEALMRKSQEMEQYRYRVGREAEERAHDTRSVEARRFWVNAWKGNLWVDPELVPEGEVWLWAAASVKNEPDMQGIQRLYRKGWRPVRPEECPELCMTEDFSSHFGVTDKSLIRIGGSVLMKRSKSMDQDEKSVLSERIRQVDASVEKLTREIGYRNGVPMYQVGNRTEKTTKWKMSF